MFSNHNYIGLGLHLDSTRSPSSPPWSVWSLNRQSETPSDLLGLHLDSARTWTDHLAYWTFQLAGRKSEWSPSGVCGVHSDSARNRWGRVKTSLDKICKRCYSRWLWF